MFICCVTNIDILSKNITSWASYECWANKCFILIWGFFNGTKRDTKSQDAASVNNVSAFQNIVPIWYFLHNHKAKMWLQLNESASQSIGMWLRCGFLSLPLTDERLDIFKWKHFSTQVWLLVLSFVFNGTAACSFNYQPIILRHLISIVVSNNADSIWYVCRCSVE